MVEDSTFLTVTSRFEIPNFLRPTKHGVVNTQLSSVINRQTGEVDMIDKTFYNIYNTLKDRVTAAILNSKINVIKIYPVVIVLDAYLIPPTQWKRTDAPRQVLVKDLTNATFLYEKIIPDMLSGNRDTGAFSMNYQSLQVKEAKGIIRFQPAGKPYLEEDDIYHVKGIWKNVIPSKESKLVVSILEKTNCLL